MIASTQRQPRFLGLLFCPVRFVALFWQGLIWDWLFFYHLFLLIFSLIAVVLFYKRHGSRERARLFVKIYAVMKIIFGVLGFLAFTAGWIAEIFAIRYRSASDVLGAMIFSIVICAVLSINAGVNIFLGMQLVRALKNPDVIAQHFTDVQMPINPYVQPGLVPPGFAPVPVYAQPDQFAPPPSQGFYAQ